MRRTRAALALLGALTCMAVATAAPAQARIEVPVIKCIKAPCP